MGEPHSGELPAYTAARAPFSATSPSRAGASFRFPCGTLRMRSSRAASEFRIKSAIGFLHLFPFSSLPRASVDNDIATIAMHDVC